MIVGYYLDGRPHLYLLLQPIGGGSAAYVSFWIDTGAVTSLLSFNDAQRMGIALQNLHSEERRYVTPGGLVIAASLECVVLGIDPEFGKQHVLYSGRIAVCLPENAFWIPRSLLGLDVLPRGILQLNPEGPVEDTQITFEPYERR